MSSVAEIPLIDTPPEDGGQPRKVSFQLPPVARRSVLRTATLGAMTLGLTGLSWISFSRPAAAARNEYRDCGGFGNWVGYAPNTTQKRCVGAPYGTRFCSNKWFKNGCFRGPDGGVECFRPIKACGYGRVARNAWRWTHNGVRWRCADGTFQCASCGTHELRICSARLD